MTINVVTKDDVKFWQVTEGDEEFYYDYELFEAKVPFVERRRILAKLVNNKIKFRKLYA